MHPSRNFVLAGRLPPHCWCPAMDSRSSEGAFVRQSLRFAAVFDGIQVSRGSDNDLVMKDRRSRENPFFKFVRADDGAVRIRAHNRRDALVIAESHLVSEQKGRRSVVAAKTPLPSLFTGARIQALS